MFNFTSRWLDVWALSHLLKSVVSERLRPSSVTSDNLPNSPGGGGDGEGKNELL